jgi:hypothetical protein
MYVCAGRRHCLPTALCSRGFTPTLQRQLQLNGLLGHGNHETGARCILPDVRPFALRLLWPLLTSRSARVVASPFQVSGEISPDKNTILHRTTAGFTPGPLGHGSFAVPCPLAPVTGASYPILVHQPTVAFHASFRRSVALPPLRFPSLAVTCSGEDFHLQDDAHAGRTRRGPPPRGSGPSSSVASARTGGAQNGRSSSSIGPPCSIGGGLKLSPPPPPLEPPYSCPPARAAPAKSPSPSSRRPRIIRVRAMTSVV